jgi:hypothetical protein
MNCTKLQLTALEPQSASDDFSASCFLVMFCEGFPACTTNHAEHIQETPVRKWFMNAVNKISVLHHQIMIKHYSCRRTSLNCLREEEEILFKIHILQTLKRLTITV